MHLIINLVFPTFFQFMNLSNLALWVNNKCKSITIIFLNLCDNFPYYMICFFSFVFGLCLYLSLCLCLVSIFSYFRQWHNPTKIYSTLLTKTFLYFTSFFFFSRVPIIGQTNTTQLTTLKYSLISTNSTLSIYLSYLYNKRESPKHRVTNPKSQKKEEKRKKKHHHRQSGPSGTDSIHNHGITHISSSLISKNTNTTSPRPQA